MLSHWFNYWVISRRAPRDIDATDRLRNVAVVVGGRVVMGMQWLEPRP